MTFLSSKVLFYRRQWYVNSLLLSFWVQRSLFEIFQVEVWQCSMATNGNYCSQLPRPKVPFNVTSTFHPISGIFEASSRRHFSTPQSQCATPQILQFSQTWPNTQTGCKASYKPTDNFNDTESCADSGVFHFKSICSWLLFFPFWRP